MESTVKYEINFALEYLPNCCMIAKDRSDNGGRLYLSTYLDERSEGDFGTVDCDGVELPFEFLFMGLDARKALVDAAMPQAIAQAARLLDRFTDKGWDVDGYTANPDVDLLHIRYEW